MFEYPYVSIFSISTKERDRIYNKVKDVVIDQNTSKYFIVNYCGENKVVELNFKDLKILKSVYGQS